MRRILTLSFFALFVMAFGLAACSSTPAATPTAPFALSPDGLNPAGPDLARTDAQGAVEFVVRPLNLFESGATLDFDVSLNTHSVDVAWDLAALSRLETDTGLEVNGLSWPVGGGHHYQGTLTFPAKTADGRSLLDGAKKLTLTIRDAAAPERVFEWDVAK